LDRHTKLSAVLIAAFLLFCAPAHADGKLTNFAKKGTWSISGAGSWSVNWNETWNASFITATVDASTNVGYFMIDGLAFKFGPALSYYKRQDDDDLGFGAMVGLEYYYPVLGTLYVGGKVEVAGAAGLAGSSDSSVGINLGPGITLSLGGDFGGLFSVYALYRHLNYLDGYGTNSIGMGTSFGVFF